MALRYLTTGESHGPGLTAVVEGFPAGVPIDVEAINRDLVRRMGGYGRGGRMKIERDEVEVRSGVRWGESLGSPITFWIENRDWTNWQKKMSPHAADRDPSLAVTRPRPGHADLAGALKHDADDARDVLERASARETTTRVAVGAVCKRFLREFDVLVASHTVALGSAGLPPGEEVAWEKILAAEGSALRCADRAIEQKMIEEIDRAMQARDSVGGSFQVVARGVPPGLGSHRHWDLRLNARLAAALCSIQSIKAIAVGDGVEAAGKLGSEFHDEIHYDRKARRFYRTSNHAGGIEGGLSNGEEIRVRVYVKPLSTLPKALHSVDLKSKEEFEAQVERTDVSAIAAAGVVGEAMTAFVLSEAFVEKFGGDSLKEITRNHRGYLEQLRDY